MKKEKNQKVGGRRSDSRWVKEMKRMGERCVFWRGESGIYRRRTPKGAASSNPSGFKVVAVEEGRPAWRKESTSHSFHNDLQRSKIQQCEGAQLLIRAATIQGWKGNVWFSTWKLSPLHPCFRDFLQRHYEEVRVFLCILYFRFCTLFCNTYSVFTTIYALSNLNFLQY